MKRKTLLVISTMLIMCLSLISSTALAQDEKDNRKKVDVEKFPELTCEKYGVIDADNLLDPSSPNYDPSLQYSPEGSRFGPPGKRSLDFYRNKGMTIPESSEYLEKNLKKTEPWPGHVDYGTWIDDGNSVEMVQAYQKIYTWIELEQDGDSLYAPTMVGPDQCRLEAVIRYDQDGEFTLSTFSVFEHSTTVLGQGNWTNHYALGAPNFQNRYVTGADEVITRITKSGSDPNWVWTVYIYDLIDTEWDYVQSSTGKSKLQGGGWDAWEEWDMYPNWADLPEITSRYLIVQVSGSPYYVTGTYGSIVDNYNPIYSTYGPYDRGHNENYWEWYVGP